ncbi:extracellular solute-binding protein [Acidaminobacter sp. JC074]|uniref:extracellular solute-binding protein n=1 Tax=Acidaminobacter sp. JC074 TaxID=2530199 RepID=UPI001F118223|nr:extracellular solute-binding protein [Acidaminobacter sp. JC074]MCH4886184.1 extracellular solute-binding protein [Acidaminobacter sp. JC074]
MKKRLCLLLALVMVLTSVFAGCGQSENVASVETSKGSGELEGSLVSAEPVEFTYFGIFNGTVFNEEWPVFKEAAAMTNVSLKGTLSSGASDDKQAFNLMVSSGNLPDIISYMQIEDMEKLGRDGGLLELTDLIDQHAPNIKAYFAANPDKEKLATSVDGKMYVIPKFMAGEPSLGYFVRQDWLDNLGLEQPQNLEELEAVLTAFKEQDPNGNGQADEVPFFQRKNTELSNVSWLLSLWGSSLRYYMDDDGELKFAPMEDDFVNAIKELKRWYDKGLIDQEIFTRGNKSRDVLLSSNTGGMTIDWFGSTSTYNDKLADSIEGFSFMPFAPPENINGERVMPDKRTTVNGGWGISASCEDPVKVIQYFDFWFSPEGQKLINFGVEGLTYEVKEGKPVYTDMIMNGKGNALQNLRSEGVQYLIGMAQDFDYERGWIHPIGLEGFEMYEKNDYYKYVWDPLTLKYSPEEEKEVIKIQVNVDSYVQEMVQKWLLGASDIDSDYDEFVERLKELGIEKSIEINTNAYNRIY